MPPGNSFPQICVVSVDKNEEIPVTTQEYLGVVAKVTFISLSLTHFRDFQRLDAVRAALGAKAWLKADMESWILLSAPVLRISRPT